MTTHCNATFIPVVAVIDVSSREWLIIGDCRQSRHTQTSSTCEIQRVLRFRIHARASFLTTSLKCPIGSSMQINHGERNCQRGRETWCGQARLPRRGKRRRYATALRWIPAFEQVKPFLSSRPEQPARRASRRMPVGSQPAPRPHAPRPWPSIEAALRVFQDEGLHLLHTLEGGDDAPNSYGARLWMI
jgi:hypothetical protein